MDFESALKTLGLPNDFEERSLKLIADLLQSKYFTELKAEAQGLAVKRFKQLILAEESLDHLLSVCDFVLNGSSDEKICQSIKSSLTPRTKELISKSEDIELLAEIWEEMTEFSADCRQRLIHLIDALKSLAEAEDAAEGLEDTKVAEVLGSRLEDRILQLLSAQNSSPSEYINMLKKQGSEKGPVFKKLMALVSEDIGRCDNPQDLIYYWHDVLQCHPVRDLVEARLEALATIGHFEAMGDDELLHFIGIAPEWMDFLRSSLIRIALKRNLSPELYSVTPGVAYEAALALVGTELGLD